MTCADCGALVLDDYHDHDLEAFCPGCCPKCLAEVAAWQRYADQKYRIARMAVGIANTREVIASVQRSAASVSAYARMIAGAES